MYKLLGWLSLAVIVLLACLGFAQKADSNELKQHSQTLSVIVLWLQSHVWILVPGLSALLLIFKLGRDFVGAPWVKEAIRSILSVMQELVFAGEDNPEAAYDRITLFQRRQFHFCRRKWPWDGWLVPVLRSGHTSQKMNTIFRAPDRADHAEGVAGYSWANRQQYEVKGLPQLNQNSSEAEITHYAKYSKMDTDWIRKNLPQARSYFAFPIKVKGKPWGVVVVDSRSERIMVSRLRTLTEIVGTALSELVERIGK